MYMLFIDESGSPPPPNKTNTKCFVLGAVILNGEQWHQIASDLRKITRSYRIEGEIKWRHFSPRNSDDQNPLKHLNMVERNRFRSEVFDLITRYKAIKLLAAVIDPVKAYERPTIVGKTDLYHIAYKQITERFQYFLQDTSRTTGSRASGIVVCDHRQNPDDTALRELHQQLIQGGGAFTSKYENLVEGLFLAPSHMSVGIQLADMVAGAVFRKYENGDSRFYDAVESSFRRSGAGKIEGYGLLHWPK